MAAALLEARDLCKYFYEKKNVFPAVERVSFAIREGETLGLVGESGSGKTTCGRVSVGLYKKTAGASLYQGRDIHRMSKKQYFDFTKEAQSIFQDPYAAFDPRQKALDIVAEGIDIHRLAKNGGVRRRMVVELLEKVGLREEHASQPLTVFSGGQRQRLGIARALAVNPRLIFCDECVSALDVSIQAQIINLLLDLQASRRLSYLFVSHDLTLVRQISHRVAVMRAGRIIETGETEKVCAAPRHPYTQALLAAKPIADPELEAIRGREKLFLTPPEKSGPVPGGGCSFYAQCPSALPACGKAPPPLLEWEDGRQVACYQVS
ncbi:MAG: ABC transporter ATP-binding protein [Peptococcaceae bacterium]|jgi:oligopeptide/dipeptide ABC transporter ATP-binding protein|nr:ABC transporter ATP-binding protein [Peptococcaceae bacterium]